MPGQFDNETTNKNFEWHRERVLKEKKKKSSYSKNRVDWNLRVIAERHGQRAAREMAKELRSK